MNIFNMYKGKISTLTKTIDKFSKKICSTTEIAYLTSVRQELSTLLSDLETIHFTIDLSISKGEVVDEIQNELKTLNETKESLIDLLKKIQALLEKYSINKEEAVSWNWQRTNYLYYNSYVT